MIVGHLDSSLAEEKVGRERKVVRAGGKEQLTSSIPVFSNPHRFGLAASTETTQALSLSEFQGKRLCSQL